METDPQSPVMVPVTDAEVAVAVVAAPTTEVPTALDMEAGITSGEDQGTSGNTNYADTLAVADAPITNEVDEEAEHTGGEESEPATPEAPQTVGRMGRGRGRVRGRGRGRGRARARGSRNSPNLALLGGAAAIVLTGINFTPYSMIVFDGEDIVQKLNLYHEKVARSSIVLSAVGSVSRVDIRPAGTMDNETYEGKFDIINLSVTHLVGDSGEKTTTMKITVVQLTENVERCFGGNVTGSVIVAGTVQIVLAAFDEERKGNVHVGTSSLPSIPEDEPGNDEPPNDQDQIPMEVV